MTGVVDDICIMFFVLSLPISVWLSFFDMAYSIPLVLGRKCLHQDERKKYI